MPLRKSIGNVPKKILCAEVMCNMAVPVKELLEQRGKAVSAGIDLHDAAIGTTELNNQGRCRDRQGRGFIKRGRLGFAKRESMGTGCR
jgi:hypothetical protein